MQESRAARGPQPRQGRVGRLSLIVVDSVSALMGPVLGSGQYGYGQALLTSLGHTLKQAATSLSGLHLISTSFSPSQIQPRLALDFRDTRGPCPLPHVPQEPAMHMAKGCCLDSCTLFL